MSENEVNLKEYLHDLQFTMADNFKCSKCPAKFKYRSSLNQHYEKVHKKIKCDDCELLITKSNLAAHKLCHKKGTTKRAAGPGRFKCNQCTSTFTRTSILNEHKRDIHEGVKIVCDGCSFVFKNQGTFRRHVCKDEKTKQQKLQEKRSQLTEILGLGCHIREVHDGLDHAHYLQTRRRRSDQNSNKNCWYRTNGEW